MAAPLPTIEPSQIRAGDTLTFQRTFPNYPATDGWALSYRLIGVGAQPVDFGAVVSGNDFVVTVLPAVTQAWGAADYLMVGWLTKGGDRFEVFRAKVTVTPNLATETAFDFRSVAEQMLAKVEAMLLGRVERSEVSYSINGRSQTFHSHQQLMELRNYLKAEVANEKSRGRNRKILGRFVGAR